MKKILFILLALCLVSCKESLVSKIDKDFKDNQWLRTDIKTFEFELKRDVPSAEVLVNFSHMYDPGYSTVPIVVNMQNVTDNTPPVNMAVNLLLKDANGESVSDCSGDICDFSYAIQDDGPLRKGNYKVTLQKQYQWEYLPNVLAVGVTVMKND